MWSKRAAALLLVLALSPSPATASSRRHIGALEGPIRLIPTGSQPLVVAGGHGYFGELQMSSAGDGLVLSDELPLERYLLGLNEVPTDWPVEAMKAQAVAARTYALYTLAQGPGGDAAVYGFDICASVQCQVFSGADVVNTLTGARWADAVSDTDGEAVLYEGRPILARYHSTSGGRTLNNEWVFPEEGPYPYLVSVDSPTEEGSPLFHWTVEIRLDRLTKMLQKAGRWTHGHVTNAYSVPSRSGLHYPDLSFEGTKGASVGMTAEEFRDAIRDLAPELYPKLYPSPAGTASGRLPETLPSNRISMFTRDNVAVIVGRGWGHGVGMSQWGAHGLALGGASYRDILNHYYTGVSIDQVDEPGPVEVGLDWGLDDVSVSGSFRLVDGSGRTIVRNALGTWRFGWPGSGAVSVGPPKGFGLPLTVGIVGAPETIEIGESTELSVALSRPANLATKTKAPGYRDPEPELEDAGRRKIAWTAPSEPGTYELRATASTGAKTRVSEPVSISVVAPEAEVDSGQVTGVDLIPDPDDDLGFWVLAVGAAALAMLLLAAYLRRRKHPENQGPPSKLKL